MSFRKKIFNKVKGIIKRESPAEHPRENDISPDVLIVPGQPLGIALGEGNKRGIQTARAVGTGSGVNNAAPTASPLDRDHIIGNTENTAVRNRLRALDPVQHNTDRQHPRNRLDVDSIEKTNEIPGVNLGTSTSSRKRRTPAGNNKDHPRNRLDVDSIEKTNEIPGINLGTSSSRKRSAPASNNNDQHNTDRQHPRNRLDVDSIEKTNEISGVNLGTSSSRKRSAPAGNNKDQHNMDRQHPRNRLDVDSVEKANKIPGVNPQGTSNSRKRSVATGNNKDGELLVPLGRPSLGHSPSESMRFNGVKNSGISMGGGTVNVSNVIQNNNSSERIRPGLKLLNKRVASSAFHNSAQRVDPPRCHPNTRVAIQKRIFDWILMDVLIRQTWVMWMHGAAGGGKSAIMQSIAELCEKAQIPLATFFFFRTDPNRNSMAPFIATLVYQLLQKIPQVREEILGIIESNPLIFDQSLKSQLEKLIIQPLLRFQEHGRRYFVILIDGLDECIDRAHQTDLIKLLGTVSRSRSTPVIFLLASRREPQIEAAFLRKEIVDLVLSLPLDNSDVEQTSDDIQHFLVDRFLDIKETHLRRHLLPSGWPPESAVKEIATTSSGQFIYASVVISYVSSPRGNPAHSLDIVRKIRLRDPSSQNPFAHLDALYQYIFSQVEALDKVLEILAYILITEEYMISFIERAFLLEDGELEVSLADLTGVIKCKRNKIGGDMKFLHASLPDFLRDKTRSERYHIDVDEYRTKLLCMFLDRMPPTLDPLSQSHDLNVVSECFRVWGIKDLLASGAQESDQLRQSFMTFSTAFYKNSFKSSLVCDMVEILGYLEQLKFDDQLQAYHHVLDQFAAGLAKYWPLLDNEDKSEVRSTPDLLARINRIRRKKL